MDGWAEKGGKEEEAGAGACGQRPRLVGECRSIKVSRSSVGCHDDDATINEHTAPRPPPLSLLLGVRAVAAAPLFAICPPPSGQQQQPHNRRLRQLFAARPQTSTRLRIIGAETLAIIVKRPPFNGPSAPRKRQRPLLLFRTHMPLRTRRRHMATGRPGERHTLCAVSGSQQAAPGGTRP